MRIHPSIADWACQRPRWQQEALLRLVERATLTEGDIEDLAALVCAEAGLVDEAVPRARTFPRRDPESATPVPGRAVTLTAVSGLHNVNALCPEQSLEFAPAGLTIVYGDNGAGKSGYVRVIKQLCRARGAAETVHSNVFSQAAERQRAVLRYDSGGTPAEVEWTPGCDGVTELADVSVFDSRAAGVYVNDRNEVAYLPHGTDLLPKLVGVVDRVARHLRAEVARLSAVTDHFDSVPAGTASAAALDALGHPNARATVTALTTVAPEETARKDIVQLEIRRIESDDRPARARALRMSAGRIESARQRLSSAAAALRRGAVDDLKAALRSHAEAKAAAEIVSTTAFSDAPLTGVGAGPWSLLWESARKFAEQGTEPPQNFPPTEVGASCVLCQQPLDAEAVSRLRGFEEFVRSDAHQRVEEWAVALQRMRSAFGAVAPEAIADTVLVEEIRSLDDGVASALTGIMRTLTGHREITVAAVVAGDLDSLEALDVAEVVGSLSALESRLKDEASQFEATADAAHLARLRQEFLELEGRTQLQAVLPRVLAQIAREERTQRLQSALAACNTTPITRRNTEILQEAITQPLNNAFEHELRAFGILRLPIHIVGAAGQKGRGFHEVKLDGAAEVKVLPREVLSEGEYRAVALASFFAEISIQDSASMIVLDDPVSSMDQSRRRQVARRMAQIAKTRPVVVFTHDLVFLWMLSEAAEEHDVEYAERHVRRNGAVAGRVSNDWPWDAQKTSSRINVLQGELAELRRKAVSDPEAYERDVRWFYSRMRTVWERAVEEVLFNGALQRFSEAVKTQSLRNLHRITEHHVQMLDEGMTRCSAWTEAHDHATALSEPVPQPDEVQRDLKSLEEWVRSVKKEHKA